MFIPKSDDLGDFFKLGEVVLVDDTTSSDSSTITLLIVSVSSSAWSLFIATHCNSKVNIYY